MIVRHYVTSFRLIVKVFMAVNYSITACHTCPDVSWRKIIRHIYRLSSKTHNYIISNIRNCIIVRLDRRLRKFIFNLMHNENFVVKQVTTYKLLCPRSTIADNYKYLYCKYRIAHADLIIFLMKKICVEYTNHDYSVCNTVRELCDIRIL